MSDFQNYFGGKSGSGTYQTIINQIPPHKHYVEGFAGMAGIFRKMNTDATCLLIEKDPQLMETYVSARFTPLLGLPFFLVLRSDIRRMCLTGDAIELLDHFRWVLDKPETFIYLDPPYPLECRKSGPKYKFELTDKEHYQLLNIIQLYQHAMIAISTYPNLIYSSCLNWRMIEFESQTRHGKATEQLWMNYPEPTELQDYQYVGDDYRDRERIARMQRRWKSKFVRLPEMEQRAMLQHLQIGAVRTTA